MGCAKVVRTRPRDKLDAHSWCCYFSSTLPSFAGFHLADLHLSAERLRKTEWSSEWPAVGWPLPRTVAQPCTLSPKASTPRRNARRLSTVALHFRFRTPRPSGPDSRARGGRAPSPDLESRSRQTYVARVRDCYGVWSSVNNLDGDASNNRVRTPPIFAFDWRCRGTREGLDLILETEPRLPKEHAAQRSPAPWNADVFQPFDETSSRR
jgi:hypothetical protein